MIHQYIERRSGEVRTEILLADRMVNFLYAGVREKTPAVFRALTGCRASSVLGWLHFESILGSRFRSPEEVLRSWGASPDECLDPISELDTPYKLFCRRIKYWECRPMPDEPDAVAAPADSRMLAGSLSETSLLFIKDKFFDFTEMLGADKPKWLEAFSGGDFAVFRLTPDKYHYNHTPAAGRVLDIYEIPGGCHSCNPGAVVHLAAPFSKNKRIVTILDTDSLGGTGLGLVAMVEVGALMVGDVDNCYSADFYDNPTPVAPGMFLEKGRPKSLFRPGGSTVVLFFEPGRMEFDSDLLSNQSRKGVQSRFSHNFGRPLAETEVMVRSRIGTAVGLGRKE